MTTTECRLALLGQACGDAFGAPFEYNRHAPALAMQSIIDGRYLTSWDDCGQRRIKFCRLPGLYTDDTQQALVLIHAREVGVGVDTVENYVREVFHLMSRQKIHRGTGGNFRQAVSSGKPVDTAGLGAAMRVGPVATLFDDPQEMADWVLAASRSTCSNPIGLASAVKFASAVWMFSHLDRRDDLRDIQWSTDIPADVWQATTTAIRVMRQEGEQALLDYGKMTGWANKHMKCAANGFGLTGFAWAVDRALSSQDYEDALLRVCASGGDTDTVAAMAGCLAALKFGRDSIPDWMVDGLVGRELIEDPSSWNPQAEAKLTELDNAHRDKVRKRAKQEAREEQDALDLLLADVEDPVLPDSEPVLFAGGGNDPFKPFSNFTRRPFTLDGEQWPTVEHYFQAQKNLEDDEFQRAIRDTNDPAVAKRLGRRVQLRDDWDDIKYDVMAQAVRAKFEQNSGLRDLLVSTGDRAIHEDRADPWWGGGPNYPDGRDWLGQILMELRDLIGGGG